MDKEYISRAAVLKYGRCMVDLTGEEREAVLTSVILAIPAADVVERYDHVAEIGKLQIEIERLKSENKAMEDNFFVVCGVENIKKYSPVTICGIPIVDALKIVEQYKNGDLVEVVR